MGQPERYATIEALRDRLEQLIDEGGDRPVRVDVEGVELSNVQLDVSDDEVVIY